MVWAAMSSRSIIGPYFIEGSVNQESYRHVLDCFMHQLNELNLQHVAVLQQDGAPAHYARSIRQFLDEKLPGRWIGRGSSLPWPPRSPDITSCDNAL